MFDQIPPAPFELRYWGKTGTRDDRGRTVECYHPLAYHGLDVAACGQRLLHANPLLRQRLAKGSGIPEKRLVSWLAFLLSLHDLGKLANGFQALAPAWMERLQGRVDDPGYPLRHDTLGFWLWSEDLGLFTDPAVQEALFPGDLDHRSVRLLWEAWFHATAGHHGRPPFLRQHPQLATRRLRRQFPEGVLADARRYVLWAARKCIPAGWPFDVAADGPSADEEFEDTLERLRRSSWLYAGLAVTADWIGSNTVWFQHRMEAFDLDVYWRDVAVPKAEQAVRESGLEAKRVVGRAGFARLFPDYSPTPLQALAESVPLSDGPQIFVIEEATGAGKTEAALLLAQRLMAAGQAQGVFVALPTMATANAMYDRVGAIHTRLFEQQAEPGPSLILAHSKRHLRLPLQATPTDRPYDRGSSAGAGEEATASIACTAWLADGRKRALLADVGVGTVDQALLGVLPVRHQSIRLWGLAGKVLIVDEVHACDSYVQALVRTLLTFHATAGGSAILLSATLPREQRASLLAAYARGLGYGSPELREDHYPLFTQLFPDGVVEKPLATRDAVRRRVEVRFLHSEEAAEAKLLRTAEEGGCACWIRNTVADAREAFERLQARLGDRVTLFHSRFTVADRNRIESEVLARFGPASSAEDRRGRILVATQVVEQSLDLDFDEMVVDLCPVDLVIQRAGRLRRHARDEDGTRIPGPDRRGTPLLHVHAPPLTAAPKADWYAAPFPRAKYVYEDHGRLWLTARTLERLGAFRIPEDARKVIEAVYGPEAEGSIPDGLLRETLKAEGDSQASKALARVNALTLGKGYRETQTDWPEDVYTPTRLGEPTILLRLAVRRGGRILPFEHQVDDHPWERSEISARERDVSAEDPAAAEELEALRETLGPAARWTKIVILEPHPAGGWRGRALDGRGRPTVVHYDRVSGFRIVDED